MKGVVDLRRIISWLCCHAFAAVAATAERAGISRRWPNMRYDAFEYMYVSLGSSAGSRGHYDILPRLVLENNNPLSREI